MRIVRSSLMSASDHMRAWSCHPNPSLRGAQPRGDRRSVHAGIDHQHRLFVQRRHRGGGSLSHPHPLPQRDKRDARKAVGDMRLFPLNASLPPGEGRRMKGG